MAKAFWVAAYREIYNAEKLAAYLEPATPTIKAAGGKIYFERPSC